MGRIDDHMLVISKSVGVDPAQNDPTDVSTIQQALNTVPLECGGPSAKLDTTGIIDADTIDAIKAFQDARYAQGKRDGRVNPRGRTLSDLSIYWDAATNTDPDAAPPEVFCDVPITAGPAGKDMMERLRRVEVSLRQQWSQDQDFKDWCGVVSIKYASAGRSPSIGLAVDINLNTDPYIVTRTLAGGVLTFGGEEAGRPLSQIRRAHCADAFDRAAAFCGTNDC